MAKTAMVTGATNGIGRATALALAGQGYELFVLCRNPDKGQQLKDDIETAHAGASVTVLLADLASLSDIRQAAQTFLDSGKPLHLLVNNAGVVNTRRKESRDGIEENFAVNHLAYMLLTELLLPRLKASAPARIVSVSSETHKFVSGLQLDDLEFTHSRYKTFKVYGHAKLCNILWTKELARRLEGSGVTANCLHPGAVRTGLGHQNSRVLGKIMSVLMKPFFRTPEQGAATSIYLATSPEVEGITGEYFIDCKPAKLKPYATDLVAASRLWDASNDYLRDFLTAG